MPLEAKAVSSVLRPALLAPLAIAAAVLAGLVPIFVFAVAQGGNVTVDAYILRVIWFTLWQAALSTLISVTIALPAAHALAGRHFRGRPFLMALLAVPQGLPAIVVVLALIAVYGQSGLLGGWFNIYGLSGIVLAHLFFNVPLAIRFCVEALEAIPGENLRLADQFGMAGLSRWRHVNWPALKPVLPRVAAVIFLLCAASFVVVLTLGGPSATTLEVAIYQSLRMDFDVSRVVTLSVIQVALCLVLVLLAGLAASPLPANTTVQFAPRQARPWTLSGGAALTMTVAILLPPLVVLLFTGAPHITPRPLLTKAVATSVLIASLSTALVLLLAWPITTLAIRQPRWRTWLTAASWAGLIVPPAVIATGWFLALRGTATGFTSTVFAISVLNALMAIPFSMVTLMSGMLAVLPHHDRLCSQLGISGLSRFVRIDLPSLARPLAQAGLMAWVISFGDLTAVMMLGSQGLVTLPSLVASEMGNYRGASAQGTALALGILCLGGTLLANRIGRRS
jgi:thiamine transport system permease protein